MTHPLFGEIDQPKDDVTEAVGEIDQAKDDVTEAVGERLNVLI